MIKRLSYREIFILFSCIIFLFQQPLQEYISIFQYWDELFTVIMGVYLLFKLLLNRLAVLKEEIVMVTLIILVIVIGIIGNFKADIQNSLKPIVMDIGNNFKVYVVFLSGLLFTRSIRNKEYLLHCLAKFVRFVVLIATVCAVLNQVIDIGMSHDLRYGIKTFCFIFPNEGTFNTACYLIMAILSADLVNNKYYKNNRLRFSFIILAIMVWCSTLRSRAVVYSLIYLVVLYCVYKDIKVRLNLKYVIGIVLGLLISGYFIYPQIVAYFINEDAPRAILLKYGIVTMLEYFPIGSGFATYGSYAASLYYSKLYYQYGFTYGYGISPTNRKYLTDNYWPSILGQFGIIGTVIMIVIDICLVKIILANSSDNKSYKVASISLVIFIYLSSFVTTSFTHFTSVGAFFVLSLLCSRGTQKTRVIEN